MNQGGASYASAAAASAPLEIVTRSTAIVEPLPVRGSDVRYGELEGALGLSVVAASTRWAAAHSGDELARQGGWTLLVEMIGADAEIRDGGRVVVGLDVRATLRARRGNVYLGQTQVGCREGGLAPPELAAPVIYRCMAQVGRDLAGWLAGGVRLDPPPDEP